MRTPVECGNIIEVILSYPNSPKHGPYGLELPNILIISYIICAVYDRLRRVSEEAPNA